MGFSGAMKKILVCNSKEWKDKKMIGNCWRRQKNWDSTCADNNLAAVKIQKAFRGYMARQVLISKRKRRTRLISSIQGQQRQSGSESSIPSLKQHVVDMRGHLQSQPDVDAPGCRSISNNISKQIIQPKPEMNIGRLSRMSWSMKKTFMDPNEPEWGWSWGYQRVGVHQEINQQNVMNQNPAGAVEESPRWSTSAKTTTHCRSFNSNSNSTTNTNSNSSRRKSYMASTVSSRAKCRASKHTLLENSARRRLSFIEDSSIHR